MSNQNQSQPQQIALPTDEDVLRNARSIAKKADAADLLVQYRKALWMYSELHHAEMQTEADFWNTVANVYEAEILRRMSRRGI